MGHGVVVPAFDQVSRPCAGATELDGVLLVQHACAQGRAVEAMDGGVDDLGGRAGRRGRQPGAAGQQRGCQDDRGYQRQHAQRQPAARPALAIEPCHWIPGLLHSEQALGERARRAGGE